MGMIAIEISETSNRDELIPILVLSNCYPIHFENSIIFLRILLVHLFSYFPKIVTTVEL